MIKVEIVALSETYHELIIQERLDEVIRIFWYMTAEGGPSVPASRSSVIFYLSAILDNGVR